MTFRSAPLRRGLAERHVALAADRCWRNQRAEPALENNMDRIAIKVYVPQSVALREGKSRFGATAYEPTDEELAELTSEERESIATIGTIELDAATVDWATVARGLRAEIAKRASVIEREVDIVLSRPAEEWITRAGEVKTWSDWVPSVSRHPAILARAAELAPCAKDIAAARYAAGLRLEQERIEAGRSSDYVNVRVPEAQSFADHPAVVARLAELEAEAKRVRADAVSALEKREVERLKNERKHTEAMSELRRLATKEPDMRESAEGGYPIEDAMLDRLAEQLADMVRLQLPNCHYEVDDAAYKREELKLRPNPKPEAHELAKCVEDAAKLASGNVASLGKWDVSHIYKLDMCPHKGEHHWVTAVLATLETPAGTREITFSLESLECVHEL